MTDKMKRVKGTPVELVAHDDGSVAMRESSQGPSLEFSASEWAAFMKGIKAGEFDLPAEGEERT